MRHLAGVRRQQRRALEAAARRGRRSSPAHRAPPRRRSQRLSSSACTSASPRSSCRPGPISTASILREQRARAAPMPSAAMPPCSVSGKRDDARLGQRQRDRRARRSARSRPSACRRRRAARRSRRAARRPASRALPAITSVGRALPCRRRRRAAAAASSRSRRRRPRASAPVVGPSRLRRRRHVGLGRHRRAGLAQRRDEVLEPAGRACRGCRRPDRTRTT